MSRFVSIWLPSWPITRLLRSLDKERAKAGAFSASGDAFDARAPLVLVAPGAGGARIASLNDAARGAGLSPGELLSNARSKVQGLQVLEADPAADAEALAKLGLWCNRYTPLVSAWDEANGADGLYLEVQGSAHLFGGEQGLLSDISRRFARFGLAPRLAIADTPGAAWAVARFGPRPCEVVPPGREANALRTLPLAALRLSAETLALARRLGLRRIGDVMEGPRAPLTKRFGAAFLLRLDQALGHAAEPVRPLVEPACYCVQASFMEPISTAAHIVEAARALLAELAEQLTGDGVGARRLLLLLFEPCGRTRSLELSLAAPSRSPQHIARLIELKLDRLLDASGDGYEAEIGYEAMAIRVLLAEPLAEAQQALDRAGAAQDAESLASLIDRLEQRLGEGSVLRLEPYQSHMPERAMRAKPLAEGSHKSWTRESVALTARPLLLFPRPEVAEVMALIPEGPPRRFRWRGVLHQVTAFAGPERIAPEWWRRDADGALERDYYAVEDTAGRRFWLCRAGRYGGDVTPRWFLHGVFA